ncbi:ABC transporter ATP-binding protein [Hugenholtzia roseola]|uniref:ABC transporter ATP-binding protein n=1 Tax=Hugenholtzia roseola TaxID=1002 RepID=UPI0004014EAF|nr:ABC transporter ATP-binding protein [Hugenholtzia roseola]
MPLIRTVQLTKIFHAKRPNEVVALSGIDLSLEAGSATLLEGSSGSGKTTLMSLLAGLSKPTSGDYFFKDHNLSLWSEKFLTAFRQQHFGILFQNFQLLPTKTAFENIALPLYCQSFSSQEIREKVQKAAEKANIAHKLQQKVGELSGGEQQRTALARALVSEPAIIFADEPTSQLDRRNAQQILSLFEKLKAEGTTFLLTTHDSLVSQHPFIDQKIQLEDGKIIK